MGQDCIPVFCPDLRLQCSLGEEQHLPTHLSGAVVTLLSCWHCCVKVHNRVSMEQYGQLMLGYQEGGRDSQPARQHNPATESNIDW